MDGNTETQEANARRLGRAVRLFDPTARKLTGNCRSNLIGAPHCGLALLRHVADQIAVHPAAGPVWRAIDWTDMPEAPTCAVVMGLYGAPLPEEARS